MRLTLPFTAFGIALGAVPALAQTPPPTVTLPTAEVAHVLQYLNVGGTLAERQALAQQVERDAQADMQRQQAPKPAPKSSPSP